MFGAYRRHLEAEVERLRADLVTARAQTARLTAQYQAEYQKLLDRLLGARGVPESPEALRQMVLGADLWEEEDVDLREDTRVPSDTMAES